jgi:Zn-dependent oligopeptidase
VTYFAAPSQMLENWVWEKEVLREISSHFQTQEPLPEILIGDMIKAKSICNGLHYTRQVI